jgi:CHAD domain-containing protein
VLELPGARLGDDPEGVHQARVAVRRLRSDLQTFRPLLDRAWSDPLRDELKWLGGVLGAVRDDDVHLEVLERLDAAPALVDELRRQRDRHRIDLCRALDTRRARTLLDALVDAAQHPRTTDDATGRAAPLLAPLVHKRWKKLRRAVAELGDDPAPEQLHEVRILAKRCRYATIAVSPAFRGDDADRAAKFAKALGKLQDELGVVNDTAVITARLDALRGHRDRAVVFGAGEATGRLRAEHDAAISRWPRAWKHAARPKLRSWL